MDNKTKGRIKAKLREIHKWYSVKEAAKKKCKIDKSLYQCEKCPTKLYEGKSMKNFQAYQDKYGDDVIWANIEMDHIIPVAEGNTWDEHINTLFPDDETGYQGLCKSCHHEKTTLEATSRAKKRKKKK